MNISRSFVRGIVRFCISIRSSLAQVFEICTRLRFVFLRFYKEFSARAFTDSGWAKCAILQSLSNSRRIDCITTACPGTSCADFLPYRTCAIPQEFLVASKCVPMWNEQLCDVSKNSLTRLLVWNEICTVGICPCLSPMWFLCSLNS